MLQKVKTSKYTRKQQKERRERKEREKFEPNNESDIYYEDYKYDLKITITNLLQRVIM